MPAPVLSAYGDHPSQFLQLFPGSAPAPTPVVVVIHGGYWKEKHSLDSYVTRGLVDALVGGPRTVVNIEFRRLGQEGGGWPGTLLDVGRALDHLRTLEDAHGLDLERVHLVGHSAGGQLALWAAARRRIDPTSPVAASDPLVPRSVTSLAGIPDLAAGFRGGLSDDTIVARFLGGSPDELPDVYAAASPAALVPLGIPQRIVHGRADAHVSAAQSISFAARAREAGDEVELVLIDECDHNGLLEPGTAAWEQVFASVAALA